MSKTFRLGIHWYRRDLRIADHQILQTASQQCEAVLPCYVVSTWKQHHAWTGPNRQQFLCDCLHSLDANLRTLGSRLLIRHGKAEEALRQLIIESGADALYFQRDPDPFGKMTESAVERICAELGVKVHAMHDVSLHSPTEILTGDQLPYRVYTPYSKNWLSKPKEKPVGKLTRLATPDHLPSDPLPTLATWNMPPATAKIVPAGEKAARQRFRDALQQRIASYADKRDIPSLEGTTRISQDLRFGLLSLRSIYAATHQAMLEAPATVLIVNQLVPSLEYCHAPFDASAV